MEIRVWSSMFRLQKKNGEELLLKGFYVNFCSTLANGCFHSVWRTESFSLSLSLSGEVVQKWIFRTVLRIFQEGSKSYRKIHTVTSRAYYPGNFFPLSLPTRLLSWVTVNDMLCITHKLIQQTARNGVYGVCIAANCVALTLSLLRTVSSKHSSVQVPTEDPLIKSIIWAPLIEWHYFCVEVRKMGRLTPAKAL